MLPCLATNSSVTITVLGGCVKNGRYGDDQRPCGNASPFSWGDSAVHSLGQRPEEKR